MAELLRLNKIDPTTEDIKVFFRKYFQSSFANIVLDQPAMCDIAEDDFFRNKLQVPFNVTTNAMAQAHAFELGENPIKSLVIKNANKNAFDEGFKLFKHFARLLKMGGPTLC